MCHAVTCLYSVLVEKAGVTPNVTFGITAHKQESVRDPSEEIHSGFETNEEGYTKSKTGAIGGPKKLALVQQFF